MKILSIAGSPRETSNSEMLAQAVLKGAEKAGAKTVRMRLRDLQVGGCVACLHCRKNDGCAQMDGMQKVYRAIDEADALVLSFPVFMFTMNAQTKVFMDRLYPYLKTDMTPKVKKPTVLCISQGQADTNMFKANIDWAVSALGFLGFPVSEVIINGNGKIPGSIAQQKDLLARAETVGEKLGK